MQQEINLYTKFAAPKSTENTFNWRVFCLMTLIFFIMYLFTYLYELWDLHSLKSKKNQLVTHVSLLQKKFYDLKNTFPQIFFAQDADQSVSKLQQQMIDQEKILASITNDLSFSQTLLAFAKTIAPDVWLTEIEASKGGAQVTIKGQSLNMRNLQLFMNNLLQEKIFQAYILNVKNNENINKDLPPGNIIFEINLTKKTK